MQAKPVFPTAPLRKGMYESFYLRAFSPEEPVGVWIRHTVHKRPGMPPSGSIWCTVFDARLGAPLMSKLTSPQLEVPAGEWIGVGGEGSMGPGRAEGSCGPARWSLRFQSSEPALRHLRPDWLYRAPLPRTKLTSPAPNASFDGTVELDGRPPLELHGWLGMVGHNWGAEHAERWIWLHGAGFPEAPDAWLDVALGRLLIAGRMTPWVANGAISLEGRRHRLGGIAIKRPRVSERPRGCELSLAGEGGLKLDAKISTPEGGVAGWRYGDPDGGEHDVLNCSIASVELTLDAGDGRHRKIATEHGGVYELGQRERDHGIPIAPFPDG
jgi:hypothetical protein